MTVRTALVTGAYGVIGRALALRLARETGFELVLVGRDPRRLNEAAEAVRRESGNPRIKALSADLSRPGEIAALGEALSGPLHVLVNNASATPRSREETPEGTEVQFAVNVLGYARLITLLVDRLAEGSAESGRWSRIVNVASFWAGDLDIDDLEFRRRRYENGTAYRQSKQAERMLTAVWAEKFAPRRIAVNACHPGEVNTPLSNSLGFGGNESPEEGADTPAWLAVDPGLDGVTGRWFEYRREKPCRFMADLPGCRRLHALVEGYLI